jgi:hypothetical protein
MEPPSYFRISSCDELKAEKAGIVSLSRGVGGGEYNPTLLGRRRTRLSF